MPQQIKNCVRVQFLHNDIQLAKQKGFAATKNNTRNFISNQSHTRHEWKYTKKQRKKIFGRELVEFIYLF